MNKQFILRLSLCIIILLILSLIIFFYYKPKNNNEMYKLNDVHRGECYKQLSSQMDMKTLILYCYYETSETKENLEFFVRNGIIDNSKYQYKIIVNNKKCSVKIPKYSNIEIIKRIENNTDLFTYKIILNLITNLNSYDSFYFINSSCIGPFISNITNITWIDLMNDFLEDYDLIGPVVEIPNDNSKKNIPFLHSYFFGVNKFGFKILQKIFDEIMVDDKNDMVLNIERKITNSILMNNGKIKSFLTKFKNIDLNNPKYWNSSLWNINNKSCYEIPNNYDNIDLNPYEIVFFKNIRNINSTRTKENSGIDKNIAKFIDKYKIWI